MTWRELVVLGRTADAGPGAATAALGRPPGRPPGAAPVRRPRRPRPARLGRDDAGAKVLTTTLRVAPGLVARTEVRSPTDVTQRLGPDAELTTSLQPELRQGVVANRVVE